MEDEETPAATGGQEVETPEKESPPASEPTLQVEPEVKEEQNGERGTEEKVEGAKAAEGTKETGTGGSKPQPIKVRPEPQAAPSPTEQSAASTGAEWKSKRGPKFLWRK